VRVRILSRHPNYTLFLALEDSTIVTSAGGHPGPEDMKIYIHKGKSFGLYDRYISKNNLIVEEKEE